VNSVLLLHRIEDRVQLGGAPPHVDGLEHRLRIGCQHFPCTIQGRTFHTNPIQLPGIILAGSIERRGWWQFTQSNSPARTS